MHHSRHTSILPASVGGALALVSALAAGCGGANRAPAASTIHGAAPTPAPSGVAPGTVVRAPRLDRLFTNGSRWRFDVSRQVDGDALDGEDSTLVCEVIAVRHFPGGRASQVDCALGEPDGAPFVGDPFGYVWIQTADGLWLTHDLPADGVVPDLIGSERLLPPRMVADAGGQLVADPAAPEPEGDVSITVRVDGDDWCVETGSGDDQPRLSELCVDEDGPSSSHELDGSEELFLLRAD